MTHAPETGFTAPEIFIPDAHGTKNRRQKLAPISGDGKWS